MNVIAKQKPFQRRKPALLPQATSSPETFNRFVVAKAQGLLERRDELAIANARWPADSRLRTVLRAAVEPPPDPGNTPALAAIMTADLIRSLQPISAAAQLMDAGLLLHFDRYASIVIPDFIGLDEGPAPFVAPGQPAPVGELTGQGTTLEPRKLEFIVTVTREMILGSNAEKLIGDALRTKVAFGLDKALFDTLPGDAARPPGLRSYNARLAESTSTSNATAAMMDVGRLVGAAEHIGAAAPFYFSARSRRISTLRLMMNRVPPNFVLLASAAGQGLPESVLICVTPLAFASAVGLPEVELVESATIEMNDTPGSPDLAQTQRVRSMFQSDTLGLKVRIPASWALRHPAGANWITCLWPTDVGGDEGGLPEAPFDEFTYGRGRGAWHQVVEETPTTPASTGFVRTSFGSPGGWYPIDGILANYAPIASPGFFGSPTAPTPPPGDSSTRLATTAFVAQNAPGGGVEEAPTDGNTYGRRLSYWQQLELIFAALNSPAFTGAPTAPTPPAANSSARLATTEFAARDFLARAGGQMSGPFISAPGSGAANVGVGIGDNATGFYRATGNVLVFAVAGDTPMQLTPDYAMILKPMIVNNQRIMSVADATAADDALNRRSADARYLQVAGGLMTGPLALYGPPPATDADAVTKGYVDQRRAPPLLFDIPSNYPISANGQWQTLTALNFAIPRGGNSLIMVSLSCNLQDINAIMLVGARIVGNPERQVWTYGLGMAPALSSGLTVNLYAEVAGNNPPVTTQLMPLDGGTSAQARDFTVIGGDATVALRSQVLIVDLGPV